jgi:hypothetical protein
MTRKQLAWALACVVIGPPLFACTGGAGNHDPVEAASPTETTPAPPPAADPVPPAQPAPDQVSPGQLPGDPIPPAESKGDIPPPRGEPVVTRDAGSP